MSACMCYLLSYLTNALWQVPLVFACAWLLVRLARGAGVFFEHRVWVCAVFFEISLPACSVSQSEVIDLLRSLLQRFTGTHGARSARITVTFGDGAVNSLAHTPHWLLATIAGIYTLSAAYFAVRLVWRIFQTREMIVQAYAIKGHSTLLPQWQEICRRFGIHQPKLLSTESIVGIGTVCLTEHFVFLSKALLERSSPEELHAALAHECAHVVRNDFRKQVLLDALSLPVAFHFALWLSMRYVKETREMVCDNMAADLLRSPTRYARSLLRLATQLSAEPVSAQQALGLLDANTLERRISMLQTKQVPLSRFRRLLLGCCCLFLPLVVTASALTWHKDLGAQEAQEGTGTVPFHRVAPGVLAGNKLSGPNPIYPAEAKAAKVSGPVVLHAIIGKTGAVEHLQVLSGAPLLTTAAMNAVRQWTYRPYVLNGEPVEVETTVTITFNLLDASNANDGDRNRQ